MKTINFGSNFKIGNDLPFIVIGGLNVLENQELSIKTCEHFKRICNQLNIPFVFKASFDKANRTSSHSFRGIGMKKAIELFKVLKQEFNIPILTDIHEPEQAIEMAKVCDFLQLPAFLARQTDLIKALAKTDAIINIKKPQFLAPDDMKFIAQKFNELGKQDIMICERGSCFGYHNLVVDFLGFDEMKKVAPVIFDVTHSLQTPTSNEGRAGGRGEQSLCLAKAAIVQKIAGIFIETYPNPKEAKCDGDCALKLDDLELFLTELLKLDKLTKSY